MVTTLKPKVKGVYLDTNFILDCTEGRNKNSIILIARINEKKWRCITSAYTMMELSEVKKDEAFVYKKLQKKWSLSKILRERYKKDLKSDDFEDISDYIANKVLNTYPFIETLNLTQNGWKLALEISLNSNVSSQDSIHLASAWDSGCNFLLTSDDHFIKSAKEVLKKLKMNYFEPILPDTFFKRYFKK